MSERKACITIYLPVWVRWFENAVVMLNGSLKMVQGHYLTLAHVRWLAGLRRQYGDFGNIASKSENGRRLLVRVID